MPHDPFLLIRPPDARWLYLLAHGAGAGMRHRFLESIAGALAARSIATLRWEFPYMAAGRRAPDRAPVLIESVRAAIAHARAIAPELRLCGGGRSMGGRMTSMALAERAEPGVDAMIFLGFPLHPADKPSTERAAHLAKVRVPMLFVQGSRDALAEPRLLHPVIESLGRRATLHEIDGADHGFDRPARSGGSGGVIDGIADTIVSWLRRLDSRRRR